MIAQISVAVLGVVSFYLFRSIVRSRTTPIKLYLVPTASNLSLLSQCPTLYKPIPNTAKGYVPNKDGSISTTAKYIPCFWLLSEHAHNIWAAYLRKFWGLPSTRDYLTTEDGGTLSLDWFHNIKGGEYEVDTPAIVMLHGLTGGSHERYVQHMAKYAMDYGFRTVVVNNRGCAGTAVTAKQAYCGANTQDLRFALKHIKAKIPNAPLFSAGFSLGSMILVKFLGEIGSDFPFLAAASLSNPMDMNLTSHKLTESYIKTMLYARTLADNLIRMFISTKWIEFWEGSTDIDMAKVLAARTLREVDIHFTAPAFGFKCVDDYYTAASSKHSIPAVKCPLLCINAADDPLAVAEGHPYHEFTKNPNSILAFTEWGAHLGFLEKEGLTSPSFMDKAVVEWFLAHLNSN